MNERKLRKTILMSLPIETERLMIRYIEPDDATDMYEYASREEVCRYLLWSPHLNLAATQGYIEFLNKRYQKGLYADWAIVLKENGKMIGTCGFANVDTPGNMAEIGYVLSPEYHGKGYMTEAVTSVLKLSFETFCFDFVKLRIIKGNEASVRLAERLGFKHIDVISMEIKGVMHDVLNFVLKKEEYENRKKEAVD